MMGRFETGIAAAVCLSALMGGAAPAQSEAGEPSSPKLVLVQHVETAGDSAKEPSIVEGPDGTLYVSGFGKRADGQPQQVPRLWKSTDRGATWTCADIGSAGITGNSDVSLAVAGDGTLYLVELEFDPKAGEGVHVACGADTRLPPIGAEFTAAVLRVFPALQRPVRSETVSVDGFRGELVVFEFEGLRPVLSVTESPCGLVDGVGVGFWGIAMEAPSCVFTSGFAGARGDRGAKPEKQDSF
ncbi:MAG TPA: sialidase family protein [Acidobacteriaceae bacterium]|jgi:hypothetical protein|nr:sialidase family protein [Acidobacteriaceae bacterium]